MSIDMNGTKFSAYYIQLVLYGNREHLKSLDLRFTVANKNLKKTLRLHEFCNKTSIEE